MKNVLKKKNVMLLRSVRKIIKSLKIRANRQQMKHGRNDEKIQPELYKKE